MSCPPDELLQPGAERSSADGAWLAAHLQGCASCRARAAALAATFESEKTVSRVGPPADVVAEGAAIGPYRVTRRIGAGAMGAVYAAWDARLEREVALKVLHRELGDLVSESRLLARLSHPNVVTVHEVLPWNDRFVLVMELARGLTLRRWLAQPRSLPAVLDVFRQCAAGLQAAHAAGIVHRDFKPDNVLVDEQGRARLLDFGLALKASGAVEAGFGGSPAYLALAQLQHEPADARSDQFAWWVSLFEALARRLPHEAPSFAALVEARRSQPIDLSPLPAWLRPHVARGLSNDPAARFADMEAAARALTPPRRWGRAVLVAAVAASALVATGVALARPSPCRAVSVAPEQLEARVKDASVREAVRAYAEALEGCRALPSEAQGPRAACLEQTGRELDVAVAALEGLAEAPGAPHARVLRRVQPAGRCARAPLPPVTLPSESERAELIASHRAQLEFDALRAASDVEGALQQAQAHRAALAASPTASATALAWAELSEAAARVSKGDIRTALGLMRAIEARPGLGLRERTWGALGTWLLECYASAEEACLTQEKRALLLASELDEPWTNAWRNEIGLRYLVHPPRFEEVIAAWRLVPGSAFELRRALVNELASLMGSDEWGRLKRARALAATVESIDQRLRQLTLQADHMVALREGDLKRAREVMAALEQQAFDVHSRQALYEARGTFLGVTRQYREYERWAAETTQPSVDHRARYRALLAQLWVLWEQDDPRAEAVERQVELVAPNLTTQEQGFLQMSRVRRALRIGDAQALARLQVEPGEERRRAWQLAVLRNDAAEEQRLLAAAAEAAPDDFVGRGLQVVALVSAERWSDAASAAARARAEVDSIMFERELRLLEAWSRWQLGEKDLACRTMNLAVYQTDLVPRELAWARSLERSCPRIGLTTLDD